MPTRICPTTIDTNTGLSLGTFYAFKGAPAPGQEGRTNNMCGGLWGLCLHHRHIGVGPSIH